MIESVLDVESESPVPVAVIVHDLADPEFFVTETVYVSFASVPVDFVKVHHV